MIEKFAYVFPGQGSQESGMGRDFYEHDAEVRQIFDEADQIMIDLGFRDGVKRACFEGIGLDKTRVVQPALYVAEVAAYEKLQAHRKPDFVAGHSLGLHPASYAASVYPTWQDGLRLVAARGQLMEDAGRTHPGSMAAIMGSTFDEVQEFIAGENIQIACHNGPKQIVIGGNTEAVLAVATRLGKRARVLEVSVAGHTNQMESALVSFAVALDRTPMQLPTLGLVLDTTGELATGVEQIRDAMRLQLVSTVLWVKTVMTLKDTGVGTMVEVGPGRGVLSGLIRQIDPSIRTFQVKDSASLDTFLSTYPHTM